VAREAGAKREGDEMKRQLQYDSKRQWIVSFWWFAAGVGAFVLVMYM